MPKPVKPGHVEGPPSFTLRVFRLKHSASAFIRTLTPLPECGRVLGCLTHYEGDSFYCDGGTLCTGKRHCLPWQWKGYVAVEVYDKPLNLWYSAVLEVTEHLEHQFCGVYERGQVWELSKRKARTKRDQPPLEGLMIEEGLAAKIPQPFPILPQVTRTLNSEIPVELTIINPRPLPTLIRASIGDPPKTRQQRGITPVAPTPEELEQRKEQMARMRERMTGKREPIQAAQPDHAANGIYQANGNGKPAKPEQP